MESIVVLLVAFFVIWLYFLPVIIASNRKTHVTWGVFFVVLFFGWSAIGWIGALIWAVSATSYNEPTEDVKT